jgi:Domain of unknown function (DUF4349)/Putative zinc-finger
MRENNHPVEQDEVMAYLDGELSIEEAAKTATHLQECRECQRLAANLKSVSEVLMEWQVEPYDPQIKPSVVAALDDPDAQRGAAASDRGRWPGVVRPREFRPWAWGAAIAGVAALLLVSFLTPSFHRERGAPLSQTMTQNSVDESQSRDRLLYAPAVPSAQSAIRVPQGVVGGVPGGIPLGEFGRVASRLNEDSSGPTAIRTAPMIARTAQLTLTTKDFGKARTSIDEILRRHGGYVGELNVASPSDGARKLTATLRVPADQLESTLAELKTLGRVESESQSGEEVTAQYVDLEARLANAKNTEKRLTDLLRQQTGKLSEVLSVETEISRVRGEIESMEAERKLLTQRVDFATLTTTVTEEYKAPAQIVPSSMETRFRNAAIDGYESVVNGVVDFLLWLISYGPALLLWAAILFFPARSLWRRLRRS